MKEIELIIYDKNKKEIEKLYYPIERVNRVVRDMIEATQECGLYIKSSNDLFVKYTFFDDINRDLKSRGFNFDKFYVWSENKFEEVKNDIIFYGGGKYYILKDDEWGTILTRNGWFKELGDFTIIKNHGSFYLLGKLVFEAPATVHGFWKLRYNQKLVVCKKLVDNKYEMVFDDNDIVILHEGKEVHRICIE